MAKDELPPLTPAPDAKRCEAGATSLYPEGTCGQGQPLFVTNGLIHCETHRHWPGSDDGKLASEIKAVKAKSAKKAGG